VRSVALTPTGLQRCVLLEKTALTNRVVQVNIRENNGGCDCKVLMSHVLQIHGLCLACL